MFVLSPLSAVDLPFSRWSKEEVCAWLHEQGLGFYVAQGLSWIKSGQTLLQASQHDLEKVTVTAVETCCLCIHLHIFFFYLYTFSAYKPIYIYILKNK